MKKIKLSETELTNLIEKVINEQQVERVDTLTHGEFMSKVDEYCVKIKGKDGESGTEDDYDKFVGNKRIKNWSDTEQWVRAYCKGK